MEQRWLSRHVPAGLVGGSTVTYNQVYSTTIQGQTTCSGTPATSCTDNTVIIDHVAGNSAPMLTIGTAAGKSLRLTGLTLKSDGTTSNKYNGSLTIFGTSNSVRVDHSHIALTVDGKQMTVGGCVY